jgi:hypothetical protein
MAARSSACSRSTSRVGKARRAARRRQRRYRRSALHRGICRYMSSARMVLPPAAAPQTGAVMPPRGWTACWKPRYASSRTRGGKLSCRYPSALEWGGRHHSRVPLPQALGREARSLRIPLVSDPAAAVMVPREG